MAKRKKGELPSGNIRRQIYDHSELIFDENGKPVIDRKTGKQKKKRIYHSVTAPSSKEAEKAKAETKLKRKMPAQEITLHEAIDKYIDVSDALLSPSTIRGYRIIQRNSFPTLMNTKLPLLTNEMLREAVNMECKSITPTGKQVSAKTVRNRFGLVSAVLHLYAPSLDISVKLPQIEHNQNELSTPDVIYNIVKGTNIELPVLLAMWLSLTESEILGLSKSKSISSDGNYITVKEVIIPDENNNAVIKNKGKQPTRDRTLELPDYIKTQISQIETDRLVTISGSALYKRFRRLVIKSGIPYMTFHDLRHVNASVMTLLQIPDKYAQERGGWRSDHVMKGTYMQTFSVERSAVDKKIDNYFSHLILGDSHNQEEMKKYSCWLTLFDKKDTKKNKKLFLEFCKENEIKL